MDDIVIVTKRLLVPCPRCGRRNHWRKGVLEILIFWMTNSFPPCNHCGAKIDSLGIMSPLRENSVYVLRARKELTLRGLQEAKGLSYRD